jgi:hypothetical protein
VRRAVDLKGTEIATMFAAGLALVGSLVSGFYTYANRSRELDIKLVEIGIGILRADPQKETSIEPARKWALDLIEANAGVTFSADARAALLKQQLNFQPYGSIDTYDTATPNRAIPPKSKPRGD